MAVVVALAAPIGAAAGAPAQPDDDVRELELVAQTPTVARDGTYEARVRFDGVPADGQVRITLHDRVRSRSELAQSMDGDGLRRDMHDVTAPLAELQTYPDGSRRVAITLDPAAPLGVPLSASGAYPLEIVAQDSSGRPLGRLLTHVLVEPQRDDESPPLSVAVLAEIGAEPALQPEGEIELDLADLAGDIALAEVLAARPSVPATLSIVPETLDALNATGDDGAAVAADLQAAASTARDVLRRPYVDISLDALMAAGLDGQVAGAVERGALLLSDALDVDPESSTWVADPRLGGDGMDALTALGVDHVVVGADQVEALSTELALSLAKPFELVAPGDDGASGLDAIAIDPGIAERIEDADVSPVVLGHHLLAELTVLWLEQPGVPRGVVVPVDGSVPAPAANVLLAGLEGSQMLDATTVDELFATVDPLLDAGDSPIERELLVDEPERMSRAEAEAIVGAWQRLGSFAGLVGADSPRTGAVADQLHLAIASDLPAAVRGDHLAAAREEIDSVVTKVSTTDRSTITLTAREGTVPLTLRNEAGIAVSVVIHLDSNRLEFPGGESIELTLTEETTRLDLAVRTRGSGAFPLEIEITSPDGGITLASATHTVQSTAVSGAGLVLSIGALLFLVVWWARHWHKTRRSRKLVDADELDAPPAHLR